MVPLRTRGRPPAIAVGVGEPVAGVSVEGVSDADVSLHATERMATATAPTGHERIHPTEPGF
jgi:hypothetical protein